MKRPLVFLAANLLCGFTLMAQWPVPTSLNTANSTPTSTKSVGQPDNAWLVSDNGINGTYVSAVVCGIAPGCCWASSTSNNADWITFPHKTTYGTNNACSSYTSQAEHFCNGQKDEFYKLTFNLPASACGIPLSSYCLKMKFNADNNVYKIYLNGNAVYTSSSGTPYTATDYTSSAGTTQTWCSGFLAGTNTIIVHVKSGGPTMPDYTGFLAQVDITGTTQPCDPECCLGNECGAAQNPLATDYEIPMNTNDFYYSGDVTHKDKVNVGLNCNTVFPGKFNVTTALPTDPSAGSNGDSYSIYGTNTNNTDNSMNTGVYGSASCGSGEASGNDQRGVWGLADGGIDARGVFGQGKGAFKSHGGYFESNTSNPIGVNYGVYAEALNGQLNYGIFATVGGVNNGGSGPNWAAYFDGDAFSTTTGYLLSDRNLKKDITAIGNSLDIINRLNPVTYNFDLEANRGINLSSAKQYGFISQEVNEILPELTKVAIHPAKTDAEGNEISPQREILALNYNGFIAILTKGIQEQQQTISDLENRVISLEKAMAEMSSHMGTTPGLNDNTGITGFSMEQNEPNPFTGETVIRYTLPEHTGAASLMVYDLTGKQLTSFPITAKGSASVTLTSENLTPGMYIYSIVADGKIMDSKRMVVADY